MKELAVLELELLWRIDWRIIPKPEDLVEYYQSLVSTSNMCSFFSEQGLGPRITRGLVEARSHARPFNEKP